MKTHRYTSLLCLSALVFLFLHSGCQRRDESSPVPPVASSTQSTSPSPAVAKSSAKVLFKENLSPVVVEEQANALTRWREFREQKPALLVFSAKVIRPIPASLKAEVDQLLVSGTAEELNRRIARPAPDRLLAADMGVAAALHQGYFSRIIWVAPLEEGAVLLPLGQFKENYRQVAGGWGDEIDSFREVGEGTFTGTLAGIPVDVVTIAQLPKIVEPMIVHIDAGFFASTYSNQVKTPLYTTMKEHFEKIAARGYHPLQVTVSHDNLDYEIPLTLRFLGNEISAFVANPALLVQAAAIMQLRGEMMYLDSFFQPEMIEQKARELVQREAENADNHYSLYRALRQAKKLDQGLASLEQAIALDPVYADEYIELVNHAAEKKQGEAALAMLDSAIRALPGNPLVKLRKAQLLIALGRGREAVVILRDLKGLAWSDIYYPEIQQDIDALLTLAQKKN